MILTGAAEVLGYKLSQCRFVYHKFHIDWPGIERGLSLCEPVDKPPYLNDKFL
jgi:hypothetical protein